MLMGPIIGAIIGYFTNYIAVKMLFRPWEPKYLFGRQLPFTPGIIPKSRERIAVTVGNAVAENLLTEEAIERTILSPELKQQLADKVNSAIERGTTDDRKVREVITFYMDGEDFDELMDRGEAIVSEAMTIKVLEMDLGKTVGEQVAKAIYERKGDHFFTRLLTDDFIQTVADRIHVTVDDTLVKQGPAMIQSVIHQEFEKFEDKEIGELMSMVKKMDFDFGQKVAGAYEVVMRKRLSQILRTIDISGIIKEKLDGMDPKEIERLTLTVAKKELGAIVNLGALIGFVLGCLNLLTDML